MATMDCETYDWAEVRRLRRLWEACLRRRGLSSESRIWGIAQSKALRGVAPPEVR